MWLSGVHSPPGLSSIRACDPRCVPFEGQRWHPKRTTWTPPAPVRAHNPHLSQDPNGALKVDEVFDLLTVALLPGVGPRRVRELSRARSARPRPGPTQRNTPTFSRPRAVETVRSGAAAQRARLEIETAQRLGVTLLGWDHPAYPALLRRGYDPPACSLRAGRGAARGRTDPGRRHRRRARGLGGRARAGPGAGPRPGCGRRDGRLRTGPGHRHGRTRGRARRPRARRLRFSARPSTGSTRARTPLWPRPSPARVLW